MEEAVDARSARRYGIGIRLVLYPLALALIVLAWRHYHGGSEHFKVVEVPLWVGTTSEGMRVSGRINDNGEVVRLAIPMTERCSDGSSFVFHWYPGTVRWVQTGADLHGASTGHDVDDRGFATTYGNRIDARIDAHPHGTASDWSLTTTEHGPVTCRSGVVGFRLRRAP